MTPPAEVPDAPQGLAVVQIAARVIAALFGGAGLFHAGALIYPQMSEPAPPWRHAVFLVINGLFAFGFWCQPSWLFWVYVPLAIQQVISHGTQFLEARAVGHFDLQSVIATVPIPIFFAVAWIIRRKAMSAP